MGNLPCEESLLGMTVDLVEEDEDGDLRIGTSCDCWPSLLQKRRNETVETSVEFNQGFSKAAELQRG